MTTIEIPDTTIVAATLLTMLCGLIMFLVFVARLLATERFMIIIREHVTIHLWEKLPLHQVLTREQRDILIRVEGIPYAEIDAALSTTRAAKAMALHQLHAAEDMARVLDAYEGQKGQQPPRGIRR